MDRLCRASRSSTSLDVERARHRRRTCVKQHAFRIPSKPSMAAADDPDVLDAELRELPTTPPARHKLRSRAARRNAPPSTASACRTCLLPRLSGGTVSRRAGRPAPRIRPRRAQGHRGPQATGLRNRQAAREPASCPRRDAGGRRPSAGHAGATLRRQQRNTRLRVRQMAAIEALARLVVEDPSPEFGWFDT